MAAGRSQGGGRQGCFLGEAACQALGQHDLPRSERGLSVCVEDSMASIAQGQHRARRLILPLDAFPGDQSLLVPLGDGCRQRTKVSFFPHPFSFCCDFALMAGLGFHGRLDYTDDPFPGPVSPTSWSVWLSISMTESKLLSPATPSTLPLPIRPFSSIPCQSQTVTLTPSGLGSRSASSNLSAVLSPAQVLL